MHNTILWIIVWITLWVILWYLIAKINFWIKLNKERKSAVKRSKSAIIWEVNEKIAPLHPEFEYDFKDMTFVGKWVDYIIFDWLNKWNLKEIIFLEIKTGKSRLNKNEKSIKKIVDEKKIKYQLKKL